MSRISERIREILGYGNSTKVTEQKKCVSELLEIYQNEDAINEIGQHTEQGTDNTVNWCYIMYIAHKLALSEADRPGKETSIKNNERQAVSSLIINTVRQSYEKSTKLLKSNEIVPLVLQVLDSEHYAHYQDTYLGILVKYILPKNISFSDITAKQWTELLVVCKKLYKRIHLKKHIVLDALQMIVEYSFPHANLLVDVKDSLLFLEEIFEDIKTNDEQLIESLYKLANSMCRQIATESRISLCKFSETILMNILHLNGSEEKYRLLLVFLQTHHPEGISKFDDGAYAYNWSKWKDLLGRMCLLMQQNCKLDVQWPSFVQFASEVVKQIIDNMDNVTCSLDTSYNSSHYQSTKRKRIINKVENIAELIVESSPEEVWPWIKIATETLRKYPQCLKPQELAPLLQYLTELAQSPSRITDSTESVMDNLYRLAVVLMENEMSTGEVQDATIQWSKIWDMLLRSLGANQNEESAHALVRCFIRHNRMPNTNSLLRLYLTKAIRWSPKNVRTLLLLCRRVSLPEDASASVLDPSPSSTPICDRTRLLEWLLNAPWQKLAARLPIDDICVLCVDLVLSSRCRQNVRADFLSDLENPKYSQNYEEVRRVVSVSGDIYPTDFLRLCYSSLILKADLLACTKDEHVERNLRTIPGPVSYVQETFRFLKQRLNDFFEEETSNGEVYVVMVKLALLARLLSVLTQLGILTEDITDDPLIGTLEKYLASSFTILANIDSRYKFSQLLNMIKTLSMLYGGTYDVNIAKIIVSASTASMLKNICNLLNVHDTDIVDYRRGFDYYEELGTYHERRRRSVVNSETSSLPMSSNLSCEGMIRLRVIEALTSFCALHIGNDEFNKLQKMIMKILLEQQDCTSYMDLRISLTILESFCRHDYNKIQREHKDAPLEFLLKVCQNNLKDAELLHRLLSLLPFFFEYAMKYHYSPRKIIETLSAFYKRIHKRNCGVLVHVDYMRCVCDVIRIDPGFLWGANNSDEITMMLDSVLSYIGHPLFILRTQAVRCLQKLLSFENVAHTWKEWMFVKVERTVLELLNMQSNSEQSNSTQSSLKTCQQEDERETRVATSLMALVSVACANGMFQGRALSSMLQLTVNREVQAQKVQKVLSTAMQQTTYTSLFKDNLNYLLTSWLDAKYPLQNFPWTLAGCQTAAEFFKKHINYIVPLLLRTSGLSETVFFCTNAGVTFADVFVDVFPSCFVWLISCMCDKPSVDTVAMQILKKLQKNIDEFASVRNFTQLLIDRLQDVFVELVRRLHDEKHFKCLFSAASIPEDDPPHFSAATIDRCFGYLEQNYLMKPLTRVLVEQHPAVLQKTLLQLASDVHSSHSSESKLKGLHQYAYFCDKLMGDLGKPYFNNMAAFLIRDVCYSLLHFTRSDEILSAACCKFLNLFLKQALPTRAAEVQDVLRFIVANLISLAQSASSADFALNLLKFLIVEQKDVLRESIAKLSSFPNLEIFQEVREAHKTVRYANGAVRLKEELERFLDAMSDENAECTLEDLANLTQQLSTRKKELKELYRKLEKLYPEDGVSILHQVIFKLIRLAESSNARISMEATRCLGELGPTDSTVALRPSESLVRETDHVIDSLTYRSVTMLTSFLVESAVELRKVSADALYMVFSTTYGQNLSDPKHMQDLLDIHNKCTPLKIDYIRPFIRCRTVDKSFSVNFTKFRIVMDPENALWTIKNGENYADWIIKITCGVAECFTDSYLDSFLPICSLSIKFCELILPRIIFLITQRCENSFGPLCDCVNQFFRYHFAIDYEVEIATSSTSLARGSCDRNIVRRMLDIVNHVRTQLPDDMTLKLDYIYLARAAHECSAYYTALLFAQLACESFSTDYPNFSSDPKIDYIYEHQPQFGRVLQDIMQDTYLNISDPDAICGAGSSYLVDHSSRVQYYARANSWDKVMLAQDIELSYDNPLAAREMSNALHHSGLQFLQWQLLSKNFDEKFGYECAWRLSNWNLLDNNTAMSHNDSTLPRLETLESSFHQHHYHALKYFHENDQRGTERALECARRSVISSLKVISLESSKTVNEKLSQLRLLREIEQLSLTDSQKYPEILQRWNEHEILTGQFEYVEPILQQRIIMFRIKESMKTDTNMQKAFFTTCLDLAMIAEGHGNFPVAARTLGTLAKHGDLSEDLQNQLLHQESLLAWMTHDNKVARRLLRNLIEKRNMRPSLKAKALRVYGDWMAEMKSENPQTVIKKYYLESIETSNVISEQTPDVIKNLNDTQVALARFADAQYEQISDYMKSSTYESLKEYARTAIKVDTAQMKNQDLKRAVMLNQRQSTNDAAELKSIEQERRNYLLQALEYYLKTLQCSEEHNLLIFRLVSLWLDNMFDEEVNEFMSKLKNVPSFKFVPLVPQLAAHISDNLKNSFSDRIFNILLRCALEHPYHTLPVVLALKNLHSDNEFDSNAATKKEERRVLGAKNLLKRLAKSSVSATINEMENLSRALVSLAYWQPNKGYMQPGKCYQIPHNQPIFKIKNLNNVLLPTLNLLVKPSGNYKNVVGVSSYHDTCEFVGGVNAPKKMICIGTDGIRHRQLVKGKDDLRQDAVMQQVFTVINTLLRTCKETKRRNLRIRTYKVVPLTQRSGVLEWCDNTLPITAILIGHSNILGLHKKYYPRDMTVEAARNKLKNVAQESNNEIKLKVFLDCCKRMRPAFQHFFEEKYLSPETWVERTLTYTRSVATTSMAGYILGLGDRHLSNILIDERTAEVVHIDFGVAFEQGKVLPIPETIPFRLTRDIEVAMGASGIEGTMRRSCEVTMTMLRDQKQIIITLLQVLLYDPLFTWAITPEKACKMQSDVVKGFSECGRVPVETNKVAKRALLRIEQKLQGTEDGLVSSVSGQVERLLQEARDPANLCRLYFGWQPYL